MPTTIPTTRLIPEWKFANACASRTDIWLPASNGMEEPFVSRSGRKLLYCFNPHLDRHAYLDMSCDMILTDAEAAAYLML